MKKLVDSIILEAITKDTLRPGKVRKPGEAILNLPSDVREKLSSLKAKDLNDLHRDIFGDYATAVRQGSNSLMIKYGK